MRNIITQLYSSNNNKDRSKVKEDNNPVTRKKLREKRKAEKVKEKRTLVQALRPCTGRTARRRNRGIAVLFLDHDTRRGWGISVRPSRSLHPGKTRYPLYRRLSGPQVRKISSPPGFDPRTVKPVASRYTDYANRPTQRKDWCADYTATCTCRDW